MQNGYVKTGYFNFLYMKGVSFAVNVNKYSLIIFTFIYFTPQENE